MTIRELDYTSCNDGLDRIDGFQVRAATPDIPGELRTLGLRDSVYEPAPGQPSMPTPDQLGRFPVCSGYAIGPGGVVLYRSSYVGQDHTGRWGNYFAQVLTFDDPAELHGWLPVDLCRAHPWQPRSARVGALPAVPGLPLPPDAEEAADATVRFLAHPGRRELLAGLLKLARGLPVAGPGDADRPMSGYSRLVAVSQTADEALLWISAVTRSLPRATASGLSFVSYTSNPASHRAALTFTTPDVGLPGYGDHAGVDLTTGSGLPEPGDYDRVVSQLWARGEPQLLLQAVEAQRPALARDELDLFARTSALVEPWPVVLDWDEGRVLDTLEFAARRVPSTLLGAWDRIAQVIREVGGPTDVRRWSPLLQAVIGRGAPVPGPLLRRYLTAAVDAVVGGEADRSLWLPPLDPAALTDLAEHLEPAVLGAHADRVADWLDNPVQSAVRDELLGRVDRRLQQLPKAEDRAGALPAQLADLVLRHGTTGRVLGQTALLRLAHDGRLDPVEVLGRMDRGAVLSVLEWQEVLGLLWPADPPGVEESLRLLDSLPSKEFAAIGLPELLIQRLIDDARAGDLGENDFTLARRLAEVGRAAGRDILSGTERAVLDAVQLIRYLQGSPVGKTAAVQARGGLRVAPAVDYHLAQQLHRALASWLLGLADWRAQRDLLCEFIDDLAFIRTYRGVAATEAAKVAEEQAARWLVCYALLAVESGPANRLGMAMLENVLPPTLGERGRRFLDRVGELLPSVGGRNSPIDWAAWWQDWRERNEKQGLIARMRFPRRKDR